MEPGRAPPRLTVAAGSCLILLVLSLPRLAAAQLAPWVDLPSQSQTRIGYTLAPAIAAGPLRPIPAAVDPSVIVHALAFERAVSQRVSVVASAWIAQPAPDGDVRGVALQAGARALVVRTAALRLVVEGGAFRELAGSSGLFTRLGARYDFGRLRIDGLVHAERVLAPGRDAVDLFAKLGASLQVAAPLRIGVEYIAQDLEEAFDDDGAERGVRHFVGPDAQVSLDGERVVLGAGTAVEWIGVRPAVYARAALTCLY
jgi:hypothetical protein